MQTVKILALDPATTTGWAMFDGATVTSGTRSFHNKRFEGAGMRDYRYRQWLMSFVPQEVDFVFFEEVRRHSGVQAAQVYGAFRGAIMGWCEEFNIKYTSVPVPTIKLHFTGKKGASKKLMMATAFEQYGRFPKDDNEADALAILSYARKTLAE